MEKQKLLGKALGTPVRESGRQAKDDKTPWSFKHDSLLQNLHSIKSNHSNEFSIEAESNSSVVRENKKKKSKKELTDRSLKYLNHNCTPKEIQLFLLNLINENDCHRKALLTAQEIIAKYREQNSQLHDEIRALMNKPGSSGQKGSVDLEMENKMLQKRLGFTHKQLQIAQEKLSKAECRLDTMFEYLKQHIRSGREAEVITSLRNDSSLQLKQKQLIHLKSSKLQDFLDDKTLSITKSKRSRLKNISQHTVHTDHTQLCANLEKSKQSKSKYKDIQAWLKEEWKDAKINYFWKKQRGWK